MDRPLDRSPWASKRHVSLLFNTNATLHSAKQRCHILVYVCIHVGYLTLLCGTRFTDRWLVVQAEFYGPDKESHAHIYNTFMTSSSTSSSWAHRGRKHPAEVNTICVWVVWCCMWKQSTWRAVRNRTCCGATQDLVSVLRSTQPIAIIELRSK